jgi:hypothetical protein
MRAIRSGEDPAVTGEEGVASLEVAIQCLNGNSATEAPRKTPRRVAG